MGVSDGRLVAQLATETLLLALLGAVAALIVARWGSDALRRMLVPDVRWNESALTWRTIGFIASATVLIALAAGLAPALTVRRRSELTSALKSGGSEGGYQRSRLRSALLAAQAALCIVLVIGAAVFAKTLGNVRGIDLGFDLERTMYAYPVFANTPADPRDRGAGLAEIAERLQRSPGVEGVAYGEGAPVGTYAMNSIFLPGQDSLPRIGRDRAPTYYAVSSGYMRAAGIRVVEGREFTNADQASGSPSILVSESLARAYWPGRTALGQCLIIEQRDKPCSIVVGVVANVNRMILIENPVGQFYVPITPDIIDRATTLIVRTQPSNFGAVSQLVAQELRSRFPAMTTPFVSTKSRALQSQFRPWELGAQLFTAFSLLALAVAAVGVYSVVAYAVSQRAHEMGVRIALGARVTDILDLVVGESMKTIAIGAVVGILIALALGRVVTSLLFGVTPRDPAAFLVAIVALCVVGTLASLIPAWRASRVDPVTSLRAE